MDQTAQKLFAYLRDILYYPDRAELDLDALPADFQKLGQGMRLLAGWIQENRDFARGLARGDLASTPPSVDNMIAAPVKELQGSLRHLAWQTQQVAKGDYSQKVDFMGDFSQAFNTMTRQLKERQEGLIAEKEKVEHKNMELAQNLELVTALTKYTHNMIFVLSQRTGKPVFLNQSAQWYLRADPHAGQDLQRLFVERMGQASGKAEDWEASLTRADGSTEFYGVESFPISWWKGDDAQSMASWWEEQAAVHIVVDETERRRKENMMYKMAYIDPLTGLNNRRYGMDLMEEWLAAGKSFVLSFVDVDYLKYCNDTFGHEMGDQYLNQVASALKSLRCQVCRVGGDEFFLLQAETSPEEQDSRLAQLREMLREDRSAPYPMGFSYSSVLVPGDGGGELEDYIKQADRGMYTFKSRYKEKLSDTLYQDDRTG